MVDAEAFEHVKRNAAFMNMGRGPVVDENALIQALKDGNAQGSGFVCLCPRALAARQRIVGIGKYVLLSPHNTFRESGTTTEL
jgi:phosphoglycerate dehydrogenase-like enzyme